MSKIYNLLTRILVISLLAVSGLYAQKLVETGNRWNIAIYPTFSQNTTSYTVRIGEDTIVGTQNYHKVYYSFDSLNTNWSFNQIYLRQDSTKKVYSKQGSANEVLLYDFNLQLKDTFSFDMYCVLIVDKIDSIYLNNGELRKRFKLIRKENPNFGEEYWIEGIGSNFGLLSHYGFCLTDYSEGLLCFYSKDELLYPKIPPTCFITSIREFERDLSIYPNPLNTELNILDDFSLFNSFEIYNSGGRFIKRGKLEVKLTRIDLNDLASGCYFIKLSSKSGYNFPYKFLKI
ncbi:MAG: T9SS type A sorting domain-containing protein [Saprospiraceae bacterium]|nr:T9SS type A sorting domain-containing protein [Saprospiraceae bacterium]